MAKTSDKQQYLGIALIVNGIVTLGLVIFGIMAHSRMENIQFQATQAQALSRSNNVMLNSYYDCHEKKDEEACKAYEDEKKVANKVQRWTFEEWRKK